jgi:eukaryotic-like serine/threonine-protein kinase
MKVSTINRFFNILLGSLAMVVVAIFSAYLAMRVAIHGREVEVPQLANLPLSEAASKAAALGLRFNIENRFYSAVPAGEVISQSPAPGATVRREWTVRVTESLGPQQVSIPSLIGETERPATIAIRRLALELGVVARIPAAGPTGIILAQTPVPSASGGSGIDSPRVSLLVSAALPGPVKPAREPNAAANLNLPADDGEPSAGYVMPSLIGLTLPAAVHLAASGHLHIVSAEDVAQAPAQALATPVAPAAGQPVPAPATATPAGAGVSAPPTALSAPAAPAAAGVPAAASAAPVSTPHASGAAAVVAQSPAAGQHVFAGDPVKISLAHP